MTMEIFDEDASTTTGTKRSSSRDREAQTTHRGGSQGARSWTCRLRRPASPDAEHAIRNTCSKSSARTHPSTARTAAPPVAPRLLRPRRRWGCRRLLRWADLVRPRADPSASGGSAFPRDLHAAVRAGSPPRGPCPPPRRFKSVSAAAPAGSTRRLVGL